MRRKTQNDRVVSWYNNSKLPIPIQRQIFLFLVAVFDTTSPQIMWFFTNTEKKTIGEVRAFGVKDNLEFNEWMGKYKPLNESVHYNSTGSSRSCWYY